MDETQIAQQLADKLPSDAPAPERDPVADQANDPDNNSNFVDKLLPEEKLTQLQLLDYLAIPTAQRHDPIIDNYIQTVYQWARDNAGTGDINQLLRVISEQEMHLGSKLKPDRLKRLAEYVKINRIRQQLAAKERELYFG